MNNINFIQAEGNSAVITKVLGDRKNKEQLIQILVVEQK
jgi:hypothetical protein